MLVHCILSKTNTYKNVFSFLCIWDSLLEKIRAEVIYDLFTYNSI